MTGSERPSPEPLLKKEAPPAVLGGETILEMLWKPQMPWIIGLGGSQPYSRREFQEKLWERFRCLFGISPEFLPESPSRTGGVAYLRGVFGALRASGSGVSDKGVPRVSLECQNTFLTLPGHLFDTPEPGARRAPETPLRTLSWTAPFQGHPVGHSRGHFSGRGFPNPCDGKPLKKVTQ